MNDVLHAIGYWLADYYLAATLLLLFVLVAHRLAKEPALRVAISWGTTIGLLLLLVVCSLPVRPSVSLYPAKLAQLLGDQAVDDWSESVFNVADRRNPPALESISSRRGDHSANAVNTRPAFAVERPATAQPEVYSGVRVSLDVALAAGIVTFVTGSMVVVGWLCCGLTTALRFRAECTAAPYRWVQELARLAGDRRTPPVLLMNDSVGRAIVLGAWRPAIILPTEFLQQEDPSAIRAVLRHEWAHVEHKDLWLASLVRSLLPVLYLHPLFWCFRRQILSDQEHLADEAVASIFSRTEYAENLIRWARTYTSAPRPALGTVLGLWGNPQLLSRRVNVLLDDARPMATRISQSAFRIVLALSIGGAIVASLCTVRPNLAVAARDQRSSHTTPMGTNSSQGERDTITGSVVDPSGKPLENVLVDAWTWCPGNETHTDEHGHFRLTGFETDEQVQVRFSKAGYSPQMFLDLEAGAAERKVALNQATFIEGRIVDSSGAPVARAIVRANQGPKHVGTMVVRNIWSTTRSDDQGRYRLYVQPDRYEIEATATDVGVAKVNSLRIAAGETRQLDLKLGRGATFHATIVDVSTGQPARGVRLWAWKRPVVDATSDESGIVHIDNVPPGSYRLYFESGQYARWWFETDSAEDRGRQTTSDGWRREFDPRHLDIVGDMPALKIFVEPGVRISGRVVDPQGHVVANATVAPVRTGTGNSITGDTRYSVQTETDGTFEMLLPASGAATYNLIAQDGEDRPSRRWAGGIGKPLQTRPGDQVTGIKLELTESATIRGRVVDGDGRPVAGRDVYAHSANGTGHRYYNPQTKTASDGSFELRYVRPGEHVVQLSRLLESNDTAVNAESTRVAVRAHDIVDDVTLVTSP